MSHLRIPVTDRDHATGPEDAPVTLVEYGDYQCPYCGQAYPIVKQLLAEYGDRVRFVFRNFPLPELHPEAVDAAYVAEFASDHEHFWEAHDLLFENQASLGGPLYSQITSQLGLPVAELRAAFDRQKYSERIIADEQGGLRSGVNGTPTFFLNGDRVDAGILGLEDAIRAALHSATSR